MQRRDRNFIGLSRAIRAVFAGGVALALVPLSGAAMAAEEGGLPQLNQTGTFVSQIFWLIVTFGLLYFLMVRVVLPRMTTVMEERQEKIEGDLAKAERLRTEAQEIYDAYEQSLQEARGEAQKTLRAANEETAREQAERSRTFALELDEKIRGAEERIASARDQALSRIDEMASGTAQAATAKLIGGDVDKNKADAAVKQAMGSES